MATMYVTEPGARIEKEYGRILVTKGDEVLKVAPLGRLSEVVLVGYAGATTPAMLALLDAGVGLTFITRSGRLRGRLIAPISKNIPARQAQCVAVQDADLCLRLARSIVAGKLRNSRTMARRLARWRQAVDARPIAAITRCLKKLPAASDLAQVRGLEGLGARAYFRVWRQAFAGKLRFERRSRRPPKNPINAMLGLGYSLLTQNLMTACEVVGLDPYDGFFHANKYGRPALALDLVEEFRAIVVDSVVQTLVNKRMVTEKDFEAGAKGGVYLRRASLKRFFAQYSKRLQTKVVHPGLNRRLSYQQCFEVQARLLRKVIQGELDEYLPFRVR